jgi:polyferredoxin
VAAEPKAISGQAAQAEKAPSAGASCPKRKPIPPRRSIRLLRQLRRVSQGLFLAIFLWLLVQTAFRGTFSANADAPVRLPYPVEIFFSFDPFAALITFLSSHTVYRSMLLALVTVAVTVALGRVFCGWVCPMGTLHHILGWLLPSRRGRGAVRIAANRTRPVRQRVKYYLLYASLGAAVAGSAIGGMLDPISVAVRSIGLAILPAVSYVTGRGLGAATDTNVRTVQNASDTVQDALTRYVFGPQQVHYHGAWLIGVLVVALLLMNRFIPRFWCRVLCPLGGLLGLLSRFSLFGMRKDESKCTDCNLCLLHCQGADSPQGGAKWRQDECHMCLNCENACPEDVIKFGFLPNRANVTRKPDTVRRTALATVAAGAAFVPLSRITDRLDVNYNSRMIRPPGSLEERAFLEKCIRCGECMKVCPNNALHPAMFEGGIEGLWTPILIPRIGYCEHSCVLCGQVCPTGAILKITEQDKLGIGKPPIKLGTAFYDHGRCLPWAMQIPCIVCEEFCPTSPKAIWVEDVEAPMRDSKHGADHAEPVMKTVKLQRPRVDPSLCIGCGACEKVCPVVDQPAIYVTSVGETRSKANRILLDTKGDKG